MKTDLEKWLSGEGEIFLREIGVRHGQTIVDFGCNVGHYSIPIARLVGKQGRVYAVDKDQDALNKLMNSADAEGRKNIVATKISGDIKTELESGKADVVLLYDILHYFTLEDRKELYKEVHRILRINGLLSIYPKHHKSDEPLWELSDIKLESLIEELENSGFCFRSKSFKKLIHNNNYDKGYILTFTPAEKT
jgi:ubiquinone/menaquinone biosynthesis C-methylase UbiE